MINISDSALGRVSSGYGYRNTGIAGASTNHKGVDIVLSNYNIPSVQAGTVIENAYNSVRGYYVTVKHGDGTTTRYQHMADKSPLPVGATVSEGQTLGTMGSTGVSSGAHLHFEVKDASGNYINPIDYLSGGSSSYTATGSGGSFLSDVAAELSPTSTIQEKAGDALGVIVKVLAFLALAILAAFLFFKAFDISPLRGTQKIL